MIEGLISGKLYGRAEQRTGRSGRSYTTAKVRAATGEADAVFVNVVAFSESAQAGLLALDDGDAVAMAGTLTPKAWIDREQQPRPALDMVVAQVLTAYHLKRKRSAVAPECQHSPTSAGKDRPAPTGGDDLGRNDDEWLRGGQA